MRQQTFLRALRRADEDRQAGRYNLSFQELVALRGIAAGLSDAEIGAQTFLAHRTIRNHISLLNRKLGAKNRAHAVHVAWQLGLLRAGS